MDIFEAIKTRRSIRQFDKARQVSQEQIEKLLEAGRLAPSAGNLQSYFLYVVKEQKIKKFLAKAARKQEHVAEAAVVFVACADKKQVAYYGERGRSLYCIQDATLALYNIWLAAVGLGLGGVWVGAFDEEEAARILNLPEHRRPVAMLPDGYPVEFPRPPKRRPVKEFMKYA